jgi:hypothetical protein
MCEVDCCTINMLSCCSLDLQVVKETMRMYPIISTTGRTTSKDVTIEGFHIPSRSILMANIRALHLSGELMSECMQCIAEGSNHNCIIIIIIIIVTGLESHTRCASRAHVVRLYVP